MRIFHNKSAKGKGFLHYNESKVARVGVDGSVVARRLLSSERLDLTAAQYERIVLGREAKSKRAKHKVLHFKIAVHPDDKITEVQFKRAIFETLREFDLNYNPYVAYQHFDTRHPHVHIVVSRVQANGNLAKLNFSALRQRELSRTLEARFDLIRAERQNATTGIRTERIMELKKQRSTGYLSSKNYIRAAVEQADQHGVPGDILVRRLARRNVSLALTQFATKAGKVKLGVSYGVIAGDPLVRFDAPYWHDGAGTGYTLSPSNIAIPSRDGLRMNERFESFYVRGSRLGHRFMAPHLMRNIDLDDPIWQDLIHGKPSPKLKRDYTLSTDLLKGEPAAVSKLITAMELGHAAGIEEALEQGARLDYIDRREYSYLPKASKDMAERAEQRHVANHTQDKTWVPSEPVYRSALQLVREREDLISKYKATYGNEASPRTLSLLDAYLANDFHRMAAMLPGDGVTPLNYRSVADLRILGTLKKKHTPVVLHDGIRQAAAYWKEVEDTFPRTRPIESQRQRFTEELVSAIRLGDVSTVVHTMSETYIDWKQVERVDLGKLPQEYQAALALRLERAGLKSKAVLSRGTGDTQTAITTGLGSENATRTPEELIAMADALRAQKQRQREEEEKQKQASGLKLKPDEKTE
jgi:hypothetical protein